MSSLRNQLCLLASLLVACGDDPPEGDAPSADASRPDAALPRDATERDAAADDGAAADTGAAEAAVSPCAQGEISCDDTCIPAIPLTAQGVTERIFVRSCAIGSSCHAGTAPQEGLALDNVDHLYASAVGVTSKQEPGLARLSVDAPEESYLLHKVLASGQATNPLTTGTEMPPPPSDPLCAAKVEAIRAWLEAGAPR